MKTKYVIGVDYGTQAARAALVSAEDGTVMRTHAIRYPHGISEGDLVCAQDYDEALIALLEAVVPEDCRADVAGICVDATSLTLVPLGTDGEPLAYRPEFRNRPHAQVKLWKRHAAQKQADEALLLAQARGERFLGRTGGTISCEWTLPKLMETRDEDPEVYGQMDLALDLCEFLTYRLTGKIARSPGSMGFKGLWARDLGLPQKDYLDALRPGFGNEYARLLRGDVLRPGDSAGVLRPELSERLGLPRNVAVAAGVLDGHTALMTLGALADGDAALVIGTSNVLAVQTAQLHEMDGICGILLDGATPGLYSIDSGQACTGDMLEWYVNNALPGEYLRESEARGISPHALLAGKIERPWENEAVAADWWNGSRNAPCDLKLRGAMAGLSLSTRPEHIYLALLQAIACGTRDIVELCARSGIAIRRVFAGGGIAGKNPLLMQEYANLLNLPVSVGNVQESPAVGSAMYAAVAAGIYATPAEAHAHMGVRDFIVYHPDESHREAYERIYRRNCIVREMARQLRDV